VRPADLPLSLSADVTSKRYSQSSAKNVANRRCCYSDSWYNGYFRNHTLTPSCESVVRTTVKAKGKMAKFDPQPTTNPWTDRHQIWNTTWLLRGYQPPKIRGSLPRSSCL